MWLVVDQPLWKMMEWVTVGMMTFPMYVEVIKFHGSSHHQPDMIPVHPQNITVFIINIWLVVSTPLKNISQREGLQYPIYEMENKIHVPNHQPEQMVWTCLNHQRLRTKHRTPSTHLGYWDALHVRQPIGIVKSNCVGWRRSKNMKRSWNYQISISIYIYICIYIYPNTDTNCILYN